VLVGAGERKDVVVVSVVPHAVRDGRLVLRQVPQPRLDPVPLQVSLDAPGWKVGGPGRWSAPLDRIREQSWRLVRR
jgi:hypothetical protein